MASFDHNYQNPSLFLFLVLIRAIVRWIPLRIQNFNNKEKTKGILVVVVKWQLENLLLLKISQESDLKVCLVPRPRSSVVRAHWIVELIWRRKYTDVHPTSHHAPGSMCPLLTKRIAWSLEMKRLTLAVPLLFYYCTVFLNLWCS